MWTDIVSPISFRFKDMEAADMIRKEGTEYLHLHRKKKDGNPIMLSIH